MCGFKCVEGVWTCVLVDPDSFAPAGGTLPPKKKCCGDAGKDAPEAS